MKYKKLFCYTQELYEPFSSLNCGSSSSCLFSNITPSHQNYSICTYIHLIVSGGLPSHNGCNLYPKAIIFVTINRACTDGNPL